MVGLVGFEPTTSRPPDERATRLRYSPTKASLYRGLGAVQARSNVQHLYASYYYAPFSGCNKALQYPACL